MAVEQATVQGGVFTRLTGDSTFNTAMGGTASVAGRIWWGLAQEDSVFPYAVVNQVSASPFDTFADDGFDYLVEVAIYESIETGPAALMGHGDKLRARMDRQQFTASSHEPMTIEENVTIGPFRDEAAWRLACTYLIRGFAS